MMRLLFILFSCFCYTVSAQPTDPERLSFYIENPNMYGENQTEAHVPLVPFASVEQAKSGDWSQSPYYKSLNGDWKFSWSATPFQAPANFESPGFAATDWKTITVPGTWQMQGYGFNVYRNIPLEFGPYDPPKVPYHLNPTGAYITEFDIPANWQGRRVLLHFEGVKSVYWVWLNGRYVGFDKGSMTSGEFDITGHLQEGNNKLAVKVVRWSDGTYLEDQDMWRFSGIYRNVYLYATPDVHISDFFVRTDLDEAYRDAVLQVDIEMAQMPQQRSLKGWRIQARLFDAEGNEVFQKTMAIQSKNQLSDEPLLLEQSIKNPKKWSAEKPHVYRLTLALIDADGNTTEVLEEQVGFREIEVRGNLFLVNGVAVKLKGVNKHEHSPKTGRTLSREDIIQDLDLMKKLNVNAIRLSHYPNAPLFYDLATEYGFYVCDEVNNECHYGELTIPDMDGWDAAFMDRTAHMYERDKNYPCIVMWSTGNECGYGPVHHLMADYLRAQDPTRPIYHQGNLPNGDAPYADINGIRYPSPEELRAVADTSQRPVIMGEYMHSMGNSLGQFDEYWEAIYSRKNLQGGFTWDWVNQGLEFDLIHTPDRSAYAHMATLMGQPKLVNGKTNQALAMSGVDDWVEIYADPVFNSIKKSLTIRAWVYPRGYFGENNILSKSESFELTQAHADSLTFTVHGTNGRSRTITGVVPRNWNYNWHRVSAVLNNGKMNVSINDKVIAERTGSTLEVRRSRHPVTIGKNHLKHDEHFPGFLSNMIYDDVQLYRSTIDQATTAGNDKNMLLWLPLDTLIPKGKYYAYGATPTSSGTMDGVVSADRVPQPEAWQMKHSHRPVVVRPLNLERGELEIENRHHFTNLNELQAQWKLLENAKVIASESIALDVPPQERRVISIDIKKPALKAGAEYMLRLEFVQPQQTRWADAGYEVAFEEMPLHWQQAPETLGDRSVLKKLMVNERDGQLSISGEGFGYVMEKSTGMFSSLKIAGEEMVRQGPALNAWRVPLMNEQSKWGVKEVDTWYRYGLDSLQHSVESIRTDRISDAEFKVFIAIRSYSNPIREINFAQQFVYTFLGNGEVLVDHTIVPNTEKPAYDKHSLEFLPKLGLQFHLSGQADQLTWYGRGPFETYPDRKTGAKTGIYTTAINDIESPYIIPQDFDNRSDVRWAAVTNAAGKGFAIVGQGQWLNVSIDPYENLNQAWYPFQLRRHGGAILNVDIAVTGVGGTPISVRNTYRTFPVKYHYTFRIHPILEKDEDLTGLTGVKY
jgi:beta-galactosidase